MGFEIGKQIALGELYCELSIRREDLHVWCGDIGASVKLGFSNNAHPTCSYDGNFQYRGDASVIRVGIFLRRSVYYYRIWPIRQSSRLDYVDPTFRHNPMGCPRNDPPLTP